MSVSELGRRAAELVLEEAAGDGHRHQQPVLEPMLVVRESSMVRRTDVLREVAG